MTDETNKDTTPIPEAGAPPAEEAPASTVAVPVQAAAPHPTHDHRVLVMFLAGVLTGVLAIGLLAGVGAIARRAFGGIGVAGRGAMMQGYSQSGGQDWGRGNAPMMGRRGWQQDQGYGNGTGQGDGYCPGGGGRSWRGNGVAPQNPGTLPATPDTTP